MSSMLHSLQTSPTMTNFRNNGLIGAYQLTAAMTLVTMGAGGAITYALPSAGTYLLYFNAALYIFPAFTSSGAYNVTIRLFNVTTGLALQGLRFAHNFSVAVPALAADFRNMIPQSHTWIITVTQASVVNLQAAASATITAGAVQFYSDATMYGEFGWVKIA